MKKQFIIVLLVFIAVVGITASVYLINKANNDSVYITGCEYIQNEEYDLAYNTLKNIEDYKDVSEILVELEYTLGVIAFEEGDLDKALKYFENYSGSNDTSSYINEIYYKKLVSSIECKDTENAEKYAAFITGYKDVEYQKQLIIYEKYMQCLNDNDIEGANAQKTLLTEENLIKKCDLVYQYCNHGYSIINDLRNKVSAEGSQLTIKDIRCYQYSYNNNVEVPVYMIYTDYVDTSGNQYPRYYAYLDHSYYGFCNTIAKDEIDMKDEAQLYTFLKIEPYWNDINTLELSVGYMSALCQ